MASVVPLLAAVALLLVPVRNPGVQACGSPAVFLFMGTDNAALVVNGLSGDDIAALRAQPTCNQLADRRFNQALVAAGLFVGLSLTGALVGLVDDRRALHRAPRFETLLPDLDAQE